MGAVIDERAFDGLGRAIARAEATSGHRKIAGGAPSKTEGWFVPPHVFACDDPKSPLMTEELFGPVLGIYAYPDHRFAEVLKLIDSSTPYALTGAVFASDQAALNLAAEALRDAAGNFYINDKPTGAVVGRQPFGGARRSGTNDKAGSIFNLLRWTSPRTIKETFVPAQSPLYPHMLA